MTMTNSKEQMKSDILEAMKSRDALRLSVLRMTQAALHNKEIEKRGRGEPESLSEEETMAVLRSEVKKRKDAAAGFLKGGKVEEAGREETEMNILLGYLPPELSQQELDQYVREALSETQASSPKDFGKAMAVLHAKVRGRASGGRMRDAVKIALGE